MSKAPSSRGRSPTPPSIRLSVPGSSGGSSTHKNDATTTSAPAAASSTPTTSQTEDTTAVAAAAPPPPTAASTLDLPPSSKRRRVFQPNDADIMAPHLTDAGDVTIFHQQSCFNFVYEQPRHHSRSPPPPPQQQLQQQPQYSIEGQWHCQAQTTLYLVAPAEEESSTTATTREGSLTSRIQLALHLRGTCRVRDVRVEYMTDTCTLQSVPTDDTHVLHGDPLQHVLVKSPESYTEKEILLAVASNTAGMYKFDADAQSSRGAAGMTTALRAASIASNMGELRITITSPTTTTLPPPGPECEQAWMDDILQQQQQQSTSGNALRVLRAQLVDRPHRAARLQRLGKLLSEHRTLKVSIRYDILLSLGSHLGGIHALASHPNSPHVYTTSGTYGDHEGPRCWLPCLDSASTKHRASHEMSILVTAPYRLGISCVGMGQDFGCQQAYLHETIATCDSTRAIDTIIRELGTEQVNLIRSVARRGNMESHHRIPPDGMVTSVDDILVTSLWCSNSWTPIPARSLGFAIGPFKIVEDPEYFGPASLLVEDDDEQDELTEEERLLNFLENARSNGEGIRQAYFATLLERKFLHQKASTVLMPGVTFRLNPLTGAQKATVRELDNLVVYCTVGVPHRALSLMRDVLALPTYRTASYTQVWIPNAVHGGCSSGALHDCPEVLNNPFLGGAIMDSRLMPPPGCRLPFYQGGRALQFLQARNAIRGWIVATLPLGGRDDVGMGYLLALVESFIVSLYERGHGAQGEGGAKGGMFYSKRYSTNCGLSSPNLDFLPVQNIEDPDVVIEGVGAVPVEDRHNEQLWRSNTNGTESHTSGMDEFNVRQLLALDALEAIERGTDKDKGVPLPSMGWFGSHLSLSFLSSNASSSSDLGCGAVDLLHPIGGLVYRRLKCDVFRSVIEGRAGVANFLRLVRAAFIASHLDDTGEMELKLPTKKSSKAVSSKDNSATLEPASNPLFVVCVNELLKKKGLTHTLFTRALRNLAGRIKEPHLIGTLVDVERHAEDPRTHRPFVDPEGFPNSYVRGAAILYCRVGVQVELARDPGLAKEGSAVVAKGIHMQAYAEPIIPEGGIAYGGPITMRVIENEGQFREYLKDLAPDGSRRDWGTTYLHAKPVATIKAQTAASGTLEGGKETKPGSTMGSGVFTDTNIHAGGYQAIELIRLTNLTPLLWVRVDPMGLYGGKISVFQPDACLAEQLFHDGDAGAQVEAIRSLAERPLRIQGSVKASSIYDVSVSELPVRVLGDCLRGSPALHSSLPHTPVVRCQAALAIAQWQNNQAPATKDSLGADNWVGIQLLRQYFSERFFSNGVVMPMKFSRLVLKKSDADVLQAKAVSSENAVATPKVDAAYEYLDALVEGEERASALAEADEVELEEDEECRVRSAVVTAIACSRAKDGLSPTSVISFLETLLEFEDAEMLGHLVFPEEELIASKNYEKMKAEENDSSNISLKDSFADSLPSPASFVSSMLVADALLALCHINARPAIIKDPTTGQALQTTGSHPLARLIKAARSWLDWELYREKIRGELDLEFSAGLGGNCYDLIAACAVFALANLGIMKQSTIEVTNADNIESRGLVEDIATAKFYVAIFDGEPVRNDLTRAACAQALACVCCAADRFEKENEPATGLLATLEYLLDRIVASRTSPALRHTLSLIMMDACTGKVCSMQRVGSIGGRNDFVSCAARFFNGPLGASHGGDNGSALLMAVSAGSFPAANAVNNGARRGLRLLSRAGHPRETIAEELVVRVARFATRLWRTINGEPHEQPVGANLDLPVIGVCAYDGVLRSSLLALWQWIWPRGCYAVLQVQAWKAQEGTQKYIDMGAHLVMKISEDEKSAAAIDENSLSDINRLVNMELDRQTWRGEMVKKAYEFSKLNKGSSSVQDVAAIEQGIGQPLPPIQRDAAFKQGGWIASAAQQRRALALDGGTAVTKLRLKVKSSADE